MPNGINIYKKITNEAGQHHETRVLYFKDLEKYFGGRAVVTFFTSFRYPVQIEDADCDMLQSVLQTTDCSKGIVVMLSSPGGDGLAAERMVNILRSYSGTRDYWAIVPGKAKSACTIVCMGAVKIYMSPASELGPVDPQIIRRENDSVKYFSAHSLVASYEKLFNDAVSTAGNLEPYIQQLDKYDNREIFKYKSLIELSKDIAVKILGAGMMSGQTPGDIEKKIEVFLDPSAGTQSHGRPIYAQEARHCGLIIEDIPVDSPLWKLTYELYARSDTFVSRVAAKAVESRSEAFFVRPPEE